MSRKIFVVANTKIKQKQSGGAGYEDLETEVKRLRAEVRDLSGRLDGERAHRKVLERVVASASATARALELSDAGGEAIMSFGPDGAGPDNVYVFGDDDASGAAFDKFFATPDPHQDKVRGFLLD